MATEIHPQAQGAIAYNPRKKKKTYTRQGRCNEVDPKGKSLVFTNKGFRTWDLQNENLKPKPLGKGMC